MPILPTDDIRSVTDLKRKTREILDQVRQTGRPVVLTVNGRADAVLMGGRRGRASGAFDAGFSEGIPACPQGRSFIAHDGPPNADRFLEELDRQVATLERFPERCAVIPENPLMRTDYRHLVYRGYRTIFRIAGRTILVVRIVHGSRLLETRLFE